MNDTVIGGWVQALSVIVIVVSIGIGIWQFRRQKGNDEKRENSD
jgi:cytochrome oxidase assembly protein ShyY1